MAAPIIKIKRSSVPGKIPTTTSLPVGEFGINTYDGKVYIQQDQGGVGVGSTVIAVNPWSVGVGSNTYNTFFTVGNVGIGTTVPTSTLDVSGNIRISGITSTQSLNVVGISSFSNVILNGSISVGGTTGTEGQYLVSTGIGATWGNLPTLRNSYTTTATTSQNTFIVNYNVGFVDIFINGVRLTGSEYTASNGTSIVLVESCFGGETIDILTYNTTSTGIAPNMISAPATSSSAGIAGQTAYDSSYFYVCVSSNNWKNISLAGIGYYADIAGIATYASIAGISTSVIGGIGSVTQLQVTGISTFTNGPILVGIASSTGTTSQPLQVTGGTYISDSVGIGTTNPTAKLHVIGNGIFSGIVTATTFNGNLNSTGVSTFTDLRLSSIADKTTIVSGNNISLVYNTGGGNVAICTNSSGPITLNVTGIPTDSSFDNRAISFAVIVQQSTTAYGCTNVTLNGVAFGANATVGVKTHIAYTSGIVATGSTSGYDVFNFTGINTTGSASTTLNYKLLSNVSGGYRRY